MHFANFFFLRPGHEASTTLTKRLLKEIDKHRRDTESLGEKVKKAEKEIKLIYFCISDSSFHSSKTTRLTDERDVAIAETKILKGDITESKDDERLLRAQVTALQQKVCLGKKKKVIIWKIEVAF